MNRLIPILLLALSLPLHSLEIRLNDTLFEFYNDEDLKDLSYTLPGENKRGIYLSELLPLMENYSQFNLYTGDYILKTDPSEDLAILIEEESFRLEGDFIGTVPLPHVIDIKGTRLSSEKLVVWMDREDDSIKREINLFARLHQIPVEYRVEEGIVSLLEYNTFNERVIPDILIFSQNKLNRITPLLGTEDVYSFKFSRSILLNGSSGGENTAFTADFGDLNNFYSLMMRFGMDEMFSLENRALDDALFYLSQLYADNLYEITDDPFDSFLSGEIDMFYGSSTMLNRLKNEPLILDERSLPRLDSINAIPLLSPVFLVSPAHGKEMKRASALLSYLKGYGVQQRVDPATGFLPEDNSVYPLLNESAYKTLMLENLEDAITLAPSEDLDKLAFVLSKIYRLVVTGRLTVNQGVLEIRNYLEK